VQSTPQGRCRTHAFWVRSSEASRPCGDARSTSVGRALIIQALSFPAIERGDGRLLTPLANEVNSFLYMADDGSIDPAQGPIFVCGGTMMADVRAGTL